MKAVRIAQFIIVIVVAAYLLWLHSTNTDFVNLPGLIDLPAALVIGIALLLGWLSAWLPGNLSLWRKRREIKKLRARLAELEPSQPSYDAPRPGEPVIPDRDDPYDVSRSGPDYENL